MAALAEMCRRGYHVSTRHATRHFNRVADALAGQAAGCVVGGGWEVCDRSLLRGLGEEGGSGVLQLRVMSDASVAGDGVCAIGVWALLRFCEAGEDVAPGGWEREEAGWLEGEWGTWRPFVAGVERINCCSVTNAELQGGSCGYKISC